MAYVVLVSARSTPSHSIFARSAASGSSYTTMILANARSGAHVCIMPYDSK